MGTITRALANNITTGGVVASSGVSNTSVSGITSLPSGIELNDAFQLISTQTASADASLSFTSGLDSTYDVYCFRMFDIHGSSDGQLFTFQGSTDGGSNYNTTITSTMFESYHNEGDDTAAIAYQANGDQGNGTAFQRLSNSCGADNDQSLVTELFLYRPDSTTQVKHFMCRTQHYNDNNYSMDVSVAGYFNTTSAINAIQFKFGSGNIDAGTIKLFGVRDVTTAGI